jgi:MFS family permease
MENPPDGIEAKVAAVNGVVASLFFLSQFLTSLLWASIAQKHGRRIVLAVSLLGNAASLILFGSSKNTGQACVARLAQGLFAGAVVSLSLSLKINLTLSQGVARGAVRDVTDPSNESRAYTLVGLSWGLGGTVGPIIGGLTEHP